MHADAFFAIGSSHLVCQDYARAGAVARENGAAVPYAIVADGCSSSPDTDFGARLLTAAAVRCLGDREHFDPAWTIREAARAADASVGRQCLDATLLVAYPVPGGGVRVRVCGDGVVVARRRGGRVAVWEIGFATGAPGYLSYLLDEQRLARYLRQGHGERLVTAWEDGAVVAERRSAARRGPDGRPAGFAWGVDFGPGEVDLVLLATDGVHSFRRSGDLGPEGVPIAEIVGHLTAFRTLAGAFLARRCRSFLTRFCSDNGWCHHDDFGAAAICLAA